MSAPAKCTATRSGELSARWRTQREMSMGRAGAPASLPLAGLEEALPAEALDTDLRRPGQHERAAAAVAVQPLERHRLHDRAPAARAHGEAADVIGVLHHRVLRGIGAQATVLRRVEPRLGDRAVEERLRLLELEAHLAHRELLGRALARPPSRRAWRFPAQVGGGEVEGGWGEAGYGRHSVRNMWGQRSAAW